MPHPFPVGNLWFMGPPCLWTLAGPRWAGSVGELSPARGHLARGRRSGVRASQPVSLLTGVTALPAPHGSWLQGLGFPQTCQELKDGKREAVAAAAFPSRLLPRCVTRRPFEAACATRTLSPPPGDPGAQERGAPAAPGRGGQLVHSWFSERREPGKTRPDGGTGSGTSPSPTLTVRPHSTSA